jgi:8-oxo-dGTP diphosphatase
MATPRTPRLLARGSWSREQVETRWRDERYEPPPEVERRADDAVEELRRRGSPCHDGFAGRLAGFESSSDRLRLELQPSRWSLRLVDGAAHESLTALCVVRTADGRWLAGRRAAWLSTWAERWALGAGGAVEVAESPADTLARELEEEWRLVPDRLSVEALVGLPTGLVMLVGLATVPDAAEPVPDEEHDAWAWWPAELDRWPEDADVRLRRMAELLAAGTA